jgi:murein DD-endopeptidase MepM/ murein hydrolase activator NlpD
MRFLCYNIFMNKIYKKSLYFLNKILLILFLLFGNGFFSYCQAVEIDTTLPIPEVIISSDTFLQGDTLLIIVKNEPKIITGKLGNINLRFFRNQNNQDWIAITGMPVNKIPGDYKLSINVPGKAIFEKNISVSKKEFPITSLIVTTQLANKGYNTKTIVNNVAKENLALSKVLNVITKKSYINKPFIYPLKEIEDVGAFGNIRKSGNSQLQHLGVDLKAEPDTPIYAINDGQVVFLKKLTNYGNTLVVDHGLGVFSIYLHLDSFNVVKGEFVKQGYILGLSGNTGYSIAPHLHFSIKVRGATLDPLNFIKTTQVQW